MERNWGFPSGTLATVLLDYGDGRTDRLTGYEVAGAVERAALAQATGEARHVDIEIAVLGGRVVRGTEGTAGIEALARELAANRRKAA